MATNFPSSLDSFTNPTSTDTLASPDHAGQHTNINDAVKALETKVGVDGSAVTTTLDYKVGQRALTSEPFVTVGNSSGLSAERALTAGAGITITDNGANSTITVAASMNYGKAAINGTSSYTLPPGWQATAASSTNAWPANRDWFWPFYVDGNPIEIDKLVCEITAASTGNIRLGLTALDSTWTPTGAPLADSGNISNASTGIKIYTLPTPVRLTPGIYAVGLNQSIAATLRCYQCTMRRYPMVTTLGTAPVFDVLNKVRTYGAFPTPMTFDNPAGIVGPVSVSVFLSISNPAA